MLETLVNVSKNYHTQPSIIIILLSPNKLNRGIIQILTNTRRLHAFLRDIFFFHRATRIEIFYVLPTPIRQVDPETISIVISPVNVKDNNRTLHSVFRAYYSLQKFII